MTYLKVCSKPILAGLFGLMVIAGLSSTASAQYLISTKAGFVNKVDGRVSIERQGNQEGERGRVSLGTQMNDGDLLVTERGGRAEILLNPGSYLRLNELSEVRAVNTALDAPRFSLVKGSAIIEVTQLPKGSAIQIDTPHGTVATAKEGVLQRIDVGADGTTVSVRQGEAILGTAEQALARSTSKVGKGKMTKLVGANGMVADAPPLLTKLDKDANADVFDLWSFQRGQTLMAANFSALRRSSLRGTMSMGWFFDPFYNCYTFIPGRGYVFSPYGFAYFRRYSDCYYYFPYGYYNPYDGYWGSGGGGGSIPGRVIAGHDRVPVRREMEGRAIRTASSADSGFSSSSGRGISTGSSTPSVSAPSAPVNVGGGLSRGDSGGGSSGASRPSRP